MIVYLEGLPGAGKTRATNQLSNGRRNFVKVSEIIQRGKLRKYHNTENQRYFIDNDRNKLEKALDIQHKGEIAVVDRSPLSTYIFNRTKNALNNKPVPDYIETWFQKIWSKIVKNKTVVIYLDVTPETGLLRKNRLIDNNDPWANHKGLHLSDKLYKECIKTNPHTFITINTNNKSLNEVVADIKLRLSQYSKQNKFAVFFSAHDGITSLYTGVGKVANQSVTVISSLSSKYNFDTYFLTGKYNNDCLGFDKAIKAKTKKTASYGGGKLIEVSNGSKGGVSYGNINHWKTVSKNAAKGILNHSSRYKKVISITLDTPFAGVGGHLSLFGKKDNIVNIWIPHSTVALHKIDSALGDKGGGQDYYNQRFSWEKKAIDKSSSDKRCYIGAIGDFMETHLIKEYGLKKSRSISFKNGLIDSKPAVPSPQEVKKLLKKYAIDPQKNIVLAFGRLEKYKGFEEVVKIAKYLPEDIQMVIFAQPYKKTDAYLSFFKSYLDKIKSSVIFISDYQFGDPHKIIYHKKCKVVLVPSLSEPFGLIPEEVRLKRLKHVVPVVAKIGGLKEQISNGIDGYFLNADSHELSAEIVSSVFKLTSRQLKEISINGFSRFKKDYDLRKNLEISIRTTLKL